MINIGNIIKKVDPNIHKNLYHILSNKEILPMINQYFKDAGINNVNRLACFLGQMSHESAGFKHLVELRSNASAEKKYGVGTKVGRILGNTEIGDGAKYKGRGIIQLTGRWNYTDMSKKLNYNYVDNPDDAARPLDALLISLQYWKDKNLNKFADGLYHKHITKKINGGFNGLSDRILRTNKYLQELNK